MLDGHFLSTHACEKSLLKPALVAATLFALVIVQGRGSLGWVLSCQSC